MVTVKEVYQAIDHAASFSLAMEWDNPGHLVGDENAQITGVLVALDVTDSVIQEAATREMNLIVTHHPVIFTPMKKVTADSLVYRLIRENISVISAHTNLDIAKGGVNDLLAQRLELGRITGLEPVSETDSMGRCGELSRGMTPPEFGYYVKRRLNLPAVRYCDGGKAIEKVAVCGGSGGSLLSYAYKMGCQALVTGDVKHDVMLEGERLGVTIVDAGHFGTETIVVDYLAELLCGNFPDLEIKAAQSNRDVSVTI